MFKITWSEKLIRGASHAPTIWPWWKPFSIKITGLSHDSRTDLVSQHFWFYTKKGSRFVRLVRTVTQYEVKRIQARIAKDRADREAIHQARLLASRKQYLEEMADKLQSLSERLEAFNLHDSTVL